MDSPAPTLIVLGLVAAVVYHVGFRFDHWMGGPQNTVVFERDRLTGVVRQITPQNAPHWLDRVLGRVKDPASEKIAAQHLVAENTQPEPTTTEPQNDGWALSMVERTTTPPKGTPPSTEAKHKTAEPASTLNPKSAAAKLIHPKTGQPIRHLPAPKAPHAATGNEDLNRDGVGEQVFATRTFSDGLLDISVTNYDGKELFYGRGNRLYILPSQHHGWQDIALEVSRGGDRMTYRYSTALQGYELINR